MCSTISTEAPKITDWITTAVALFGVPFTAIGFWKLATRDKDKEKQIANIVKITEQLAQQVQELSSQTSEFRYQSNMMFEHNKLMEKQIELNTIAYSEHRSFEVEKLSLAKQERRMNIRPYFTLRHSVRQGYTHEIELVNKGQRANDIKVHSNTDSTFTVKTKKTEIDHLGLLHVTGSSNLIDLYRRFEFTITFNDQDGNMYSQTISIQNTNYDVSVPNPISVVA